MSIPEVRDDVGMSGRKDMTILSLPNEILTKIMLELNANDRFNFSKINDRLRDVDLMTGHRTFNSITTFSVNGIMKIRTEDKVRGKIDVDVRDLEAIPLFNHSTTRVLVIQTLMSIEGARILHIAFRTLKYEKLNVFLVDDCTARFIEMLVQGRQFIENVSIGWTNRVNDMERTKRVLMSLPPINKLSVTASYVNHQTIDDDLLLHLVSKVNFADLYCRNTTITANGLARAFEMICCSQTEKEVVFNIDPSAVSQWIHQWDVSKFEINEYQFRHRESGARCIVCRESINISSESLVILRQKFDLSE